LYLCLEPSQKILTIVHFCVEVQMKFDIYVFLKQRTDGNSHLFSDTRFVKKIGTIKARL
jgi:hypothetical protein